MKERWAEIVAGQRLNMGKVGHFGLENLNTAYEVFQYTLVWEAG